MEQGRLLYFHVVVSSSFFLFLAYSPCSFCFIGSSVHIVAEYICMNFEQMFLGHFSEHFLR